MRRGWQAMTWAVLATLAGPMLLALAAPLAVANHQFLPGHELQGVQASAQVQRTPTLENLTIAQGDAAGADCDTPDDVTIDHEGRSFSFDEGNIDGACIEFSLPIDVPGSAQRLRVSFAANRTITTSLGGLSPNALQAFRILTETGDVALERAYFDNTERSSPFENFTVDENLPQGTQSVVLAWRFEDRESTEDQLIPTFTTFAATVRNITLDWSAIPVPVQVQAPVEGQPNAALNASASTHVVNLAPDPEFWMSGRRPAMLLRLAHGPEMLSVSGPNGALVGSDVVRIDDGSQMLVVFPNATLLREGPGGYEVTFRTLVALPAAEKAAEPQTLEPFYYTLLALPAPAALLAVYSAGAYRAEAIGRYRRASIGLLALVLAAVLYYLVLVAYALFGARAATMATLPLEPEATLVYVQLIVLLLFFVVAAVVVGRYLANAMRRDIEARRIQEEKLRRSNEELERFAYVASHDLQEPLRKVAGFTSLLQRRYKGRLDKDADEMIQYAVDGATRMQALIRDILAYSRVGSSELDPRPVDLDSVMELVVADLGERIKESTATVQWSGLPRVLADAGQVRQVLQNLVENGIKYRHPGRRPRVRVAAQRDGGFVRLAVHDNGQGIPSDKLGEIFGIFRRLHGQDVPGTGIGLAVVKKAVERHGGKVWAESRLGRGSTFFVTLPAAPDVAPRQPPSATLLGRPSPWEAADPA